VGEQRRTGRHQHRRLSRRAGIRPGHRMGHPERGRADRELAMRTTMLKHVLILVGALALAGCHHDNNGTSDGGGGSGGGGSGDADMATGGDMADTGLPPAPTATHVGATGNTSNLVTDGAGHAAYLVGAAPVMSGSFKIGIAG